MNFFIIWLQIPHTTKKLFRRYLKLKETRRYVLNAMNKAKKETIIEMVILINGMTLSEGDINYLFQEQEEVAGQVKLLKSLLLWTINSLNSFNMPSFQEFQLDSQNL